MRGKIHHRRVVTRCISRTTRRSACTISPASWISQLGRLIGVRGLSRMPWCPFQKTLIILALILLIRTVLKAIWWRARRWLATVATASTRKAQRHWIRKAAREYRLVKATTSRISSMIVRRQVWCALRATSTIKAMQWSPLLPQHWSFKGKRSNLIKIQKVNWTTLPAKLNRFQSS